MASGSSESNETETNEQKVIELKEKMLSIVIGDPLALEMFRDEGFQLLTRRLNPQLPTLDPLQVLDEMWAILKERARQRLRRGGRASRVAFHLCVFPFRLEAGHYVTVEVVYATPEGNARRGCPIACLPVPMPLTEANEGDENERMLAAQSLSEAIVAEVDAFGVRDEIEEVAVWGQRWRQLRENLTREMATTTDLSMDSRGKLPAEKMSHCLEMLLSKCASRSRGIRKQPWPEEASDAHPAAAHLRRLLRQCERKSGNVKRCATELSERMRAAREDTEQLMVYDAYDGRRTVPELVLVGDYRTALESLHDRLKRLQRLRHFEKQRVDRSASTAETGCPTDTEQNAGSDVDRQLLSRARRTFAKIERTLAECGAISSEYRSLCRLLQQFREENVDFVLTPHAKEISRYVQLVRQLRSGEDFLLDNNRWVTVGSIRALYKWLNDETPREAPVQTRADWTTNLTSITN